jgi:hypothetical protein
MIAIKIVSHLQRFKWPLSLTITVLVIVIAPGAARAADPGISLTSSPVSMDLVVQPGTSTTRTLQLMNNGTSPVKITMHLDEFSAKGVNGQAIITQPAPNDPSPKWVGFSPASFTAQPGVWESVKMTISLPKSAQLGYYYAVVFSPDVTTAPTTRANIIKGSNGVLVLVDTQSGNEKRAADIANFSVSKKVYEYLPATFTVSIHNSGNIYLAPFGNIYISHSANLTHTIAVLNVNPNGGNVLPQSNRDFSATWDDGFPSFQNKTIDGQVVRDKAGKPVQQLHWNFAETKKLRFGKYYAKLTLLYNNGKRTIPITSIVSFWVIPWKLLGGFIIVVVALLAAAWFGRQRLRRAAKVLFGKDA